MRGHRRCGLALALAPLVPLVRVQGQGWPGCSEVGVLLRGHGQYAVFTDVREHGFSSGCFVGDCSYTDKFDVASDAECANVCAKVAECHHWSTGPEDDQLRCWLRSSDAGREPQDGYQTGTKSCAPPPWPECMERGVVLRAQGKWGLFLDVTAFGSTGCFLGDCANSDKFAVTSEASCGRACAAVVGCEYWSVGYEDGEMKCWLRGLGALEGREEAQGFVSALRACAPPDSIYASGDIDFIEADMPSAPEPTSESRAALVAVAPGNVACWGGGFSFELCCASEHGDEGNTSCWDAAFTFRHCCFAPEKTKTEL